MLAMCCLQTFEQIHQTFPFQFRSREELGDRSRPDLVRARNEGLCLIRPNEGYHSPVYILTYTMSAF